MSDWLSILRSEITKSGSIAAVARKLDYARTTISLVHHGRYGGSTDRIAARVIEVFASNVDCPHVGTEIERSECDTMRHATMPTNSAARLRHWTACQSCPIHQASYTPTKGRKMQ